MVIRVKTDDDGSKALDLIVERFKDYIVTNGKYPESVQFFMKEMEQSEDLFYNHFTSFNVLEGSIWSGFIDETVKAIKNDKVYYEYGAQEKLLAFYYTLIELVKNDRDYIKMTLHRLKKCKVSPRFLKNTRLNYITFVQGIISEGIANSEIANRPFISDKYKNALIQQLIFVLLVKVI